MVIQYNNPMEDQRPSWDEYFMQLARFVSSRSTCLHRNVGALLVRGKHIISSGYNGAPRGLPHCLELGCLKDQKGIPSGQGQEVCRATHAEANAIIQAALHGVSTAGATLYCTTAPCTVCAKMLINAGVKRIVYAEGYPDRLGLEMLQQANVKVEEYSSL